MVWKRYSKIEFHEEDEDDVEEVDEYREIDLQYDDKYMWKR